MKHRFTITFTKDFLDSLDSLATRIGDTKGEAIRTTITFFDYIRKFIDADPSGRTHVAIITEDEEGNIVSHKEIKIPQLEKA